MTSKAVTPATRTVEIDGETYSLKFNFGFACAAERELGVSIQKAFSADALIANTVGAGWWAALQANHPMTREASDELIDAAGFAAVSEWVILGVNEYFNGGKAAAKAGEPGKAPRKRASTRR